MERVGTMTDAERQGYRFVGTRVKAGGLGHAALQLRLTGMPYWEIADQLGEEETVVTKAVHGQLNRLIGMEVRDADTARMLHLERLDAIMAGSWAKAVAGSPDHAVTVLRCMERQSRLLGLDVPQKIDITHRLRALALEQGLDPDELIAEAHAVLKSLPKG
jgi:hypothetical protein